jgi:hypothetical protein
MATMTRLSLTLDPMGTSHFHLFFWNHITDLNQTWQKCSLVPIGKRFTILAQDHPTIIPAKSQFNWLGGFWQEDFLNFSQWEHIMDPGSHVGFQISTKNTHLVEDHPMNISGKFGWNLFSGFREIIIGWSCTKFVNCLPIGNSRWPPWLDLV